MNNITKVDLSDAELHDENTSDQVEELQDYELGEVVSTEDGDGIIAAFVEDTFSFPVGQSEGQIEEVEDPEDEPETEEIEASSDEPMYIVALQEGGSVAVSADEIDSDGSLEGEGKDIQSFEDVGNEAGEAELSPVYALCDDPSNSEELETAKRELIMERQAASLADYVEDKGVSLAELEGYSYEELVNIRGVDDPHVGFDSLPDGWTRKSVLDAWVSVGGTWRTCYARMVRSMGTNFAKRWCAALKDETLRTEEWRGDF